MQRVRKRKSSYWRPLRSTMTSAPKTRRRPKSISQLVWNRCSSPCRSSPRRFPAAQVRSQLQALAGLLFKIELRKTARCCDPESLIPDEVGNLSIFRLVSWNRRAAPLSHLVLGGRRFLRRRVPGCARKTACRPEVWTVPAHSIRGVKTGRFLFMKKKFHLFSIF